MKRSNSEIELMLKNAYTNITPSADCAAVSPRPAKNNVIEMSSARTRRQGWQYKVASLAAAFALVFIGAFGYMSYNEHNTVDAIVDIDVNPSVELKLNKSDKILEVNAVNDDAEKILSELELSQADLDDAIDMIIGAMVEHGYISHDANAVLISVGNHDEQRNEALKDRLSTEVEEVLRQRSIDPAIFSQTVRDGEAKPLADQYGISLGKATLIRDIVSSDNRLNPGELSQLPVNDILLIAGSKAQNVVNSVSGSASDKAYIGEGAARAAAFSHAGVNLMNALNITIGMNVENGTMIYEVGFVAAGIPFSYEIDAKTGAILGFIGKLISPLPADTSDAANSVPSENAAPPSSGGEQAKPEPEPEAPPEDPGPQEPVYAVSAEQAQAIALESLGVTAEQVTDLGVNLENKDEGANYRVEFTLGAKDYTYRIDADSGKIVMRGWQLNGNVEEVLPPVEEPEAPPAEEPDDPAAPPEEPGETPDAPQPENPDAEPSVPEDGGTAEAPETEPETETAA